MPTNFPTNLDSFANPNPNDLVENTTDVLDHHRQHADANDAIEALQAKVGVDDSAVPTSLEYRTKQLEIGLYGSARAQATGALTPVTTVPQDIPGASVTISTVFPNTALVVMGVVDWSASASTDVQVGNLVVDGVAQTGQLLSTALRGTSGQTWRVVLAAAGVHTLKLQASKVGAANAVTANPTHTSITVFGLGVSV